MSDIAGVLAALSAPALDANARFVCPGADGPCPQPKPDVAGIVLDQRHFRLDVLVNPRFLAVRAAADERYLKAPGGSASLVDEIGGALAGGGGETLLYNV